LLITQTSSQSKRARLSSVRDGFVLLLTFDVFDV